jgi:hypothetical protein
MGSEDVSNKRQWKDASVGIAVSTINTRSVVDQALLLLSYRLDYQEIVVRFQAEAHMGLYRVQTSCVVPGYLF